MKRRITILAAILSIALCPAVARAVSPFADAAPKVAASWGMRGDVLCCFYDDAHVPLAAGPAQIDAPEGQIGVALSIEGTTVREAALYAERTAEGTVATARLSTRRAANSALFTIISRAQPITRAEADDRSGLTGIKGKWYQRSGKGMQYLEKSALAPLQAMLTAAKADGCRGIHISSSYRDYAYQKSLFDASVKKDQKKGMSYDEAYESTATRTAVPGGSEHHKGYTFDLLESGSTMSASFARTRLGKWLAAHAPEYGFTIRYPKDKTEITRIIYEPWHVRYVGVPAAQMLQENGWCMEEFHAALRQKKRITWHKDGAGIYIYLDEAVAYGDTLSLSATGAGGTIIALQVNPSPA